MSKSHSPLAGSLTLALIAIAFCVWSALGNDVNICVTTGCTLYADFSIGGISMWWFGVVAFTLLAACALLGQANLGRYLAGLCLLGDICLMLLMALTAPCVSCLIVALFFALCYVSFRRAAWTRQRPGQTQPALHSILLWVWLALFIVNLGQVARSQISVWPLLDESGEPVTRMFFSPSCRYCVEGINALSGKVDVAFYPVAENDADVARIKNMMDLLQQGESMAAALTQSGEAKFSGFWDAWKPTTLLLRFRLVCNKAHLFALGSQGVPFFEQKGLMPGMLNNKKPVEQIIESAPSAVPLGTDHTLPPELSGGQQCGGQVPCPPEQIF